MAEYVFTNPHVSFGGTEISDHVRSITINTGVEAVDFTAGGDSTRNFKAGLNTWTVSIEFYADFAASELDALIDGLSDNEAALVFKPVNGATAATNPKWTGTGLLTSHSPIMGAVGDAAMHPIELVAASDLTRAESD